MEHAVAELLVPRELTLGLAESLTGGLIGARLVNVPGSSRWFRGCIVAYDSVVKHSLLGVPPGPVVSAEAAERMAEGARAALGSDIGLGITGVAGPDEQDGQRPGTVFVGIALPDRAVFSQQLQLPGDRERVRQFSSISALDILRRSLIGSGG
jgi:nicotinamide-nucleotide amidase